MRRFVFLYSAILLASSVAVLAGAMAFRPLPTADCAQPIPTAKTEKKAAKKFPRGHKAPSVCELKKRHDEAFRRHDHRMKHLPKATPATFDVRTLGWTGPIQDQGQCGSCWDVSTCGVCTDTFIKSGQWTATDATKTLSPQYVLDCGNNGGCNGDDAPTVLDMCKSGGLPTTADYGPYVAAPQRCNYSNQKLYKIADWGFCTPSQQGGIAATQDIKNALAQYGTISTAVAADDSWNSVGSDGVIPYNPLTPNDVDHDVAIVGWDDTKQIPGAPAAGAWIVKNQWGTVWGANGYCWLAYGSHQIGTEAAWATATTLPPSPTPPTPSPTPPTPGPTPTPTPIPSGPFTGTLVFQNGVLVGVVPGAPTPSVGDDLKSAGVSPTVIVDVLQLLADLKARAGVAVIAADVLKIIADISAPAVPAPKSK